MQNHRLYWVAVLVTTSLACSVCAKETQGKDAQGRDYWLYTPDRIDPDKTYTLVVGVHGYRGKGRGAGGFAGWVDKHDVIVLGPTYDSNGYQYLQKGSDRQTLDLIEQLREDYRLHDKIFISGFSGGSQYAHRFAMKYPELVAGCAAHSGGTWATGDYAERAVPNPKARGVLFVISCGEEDTMKSFPQAPMGRLEWAKKYETLLDEGGFTYDARWWPGVGHRLSEGAREQTRDCFIASTERLPAYEEERGAIAEAIRQKDHAAAWRIVQSRRNHADKDDEGILGKALQAYLDSLLFKIEEIDRLAAHEVFRINDEQGNVEKRRAALQRYKEAYAGLPRTQRTVDRALAGLE